MKPLLITTLCAIAAGFAGGFASQTFLSSPVVHAQTAHIEPPSTPEKSAPSEIRAERFVMVDANGNIRGEFKTEKGNPEIVLYYADGRTWKAPSPTLQH
ncbi:MAG: hypothetical protein M3Y57_19490 [Acidobacteriota bacterium]|nr:hypothetical protein [Acidobacteriota bacterium]